MIFQDESGDIDTELSYSWEAELDDEIIGKALSSPLFIQEREEPADRRQACHSVEESLFPAQSLSVCRARTERPVHEFGSLSSRSREKPSRDSENEQIRILLERQKEQILAEVRTEIQKHEFQADSWKKKYTGINWNYWVSAERDWSYFCRWWTTPTRSATSDVLQILSLSSCYKKNMRLMHSSEGIEEMVCELDGYRSDAISLSETWRPDKS